MRKFSEVNTQSSLRYILIGISTLVLLIAVGSAAYFYMQYRSLATLQGGKEDIKALTAKISNFMVLPSESPTIATVTDPKKLQGQSFFTKAQVEDKVLIYLEAKKAILYRPSENKIIDFAPVNTVKTSVTPTPFQLNAPQESTTPTPSNSNRK